MLSLQKRHTAAPQEPSAIPSSFIRSLISYPSEGIPRDIEERIASLKVLPDDFPVVPYLDAGYRRMGLAKRFAGKRITIWQRIDRGEITELQRLSEDKKAKEDWHAAERLLESALPFEVVTPLNYMLRRWHDFARVLDGGRICLTNNCAERALRGIVLGRWNWTFAGSQRCANRAAIMLTAITTCRLKRSPPRLGSTTSSPVSPIFPHRVCTNCPDQQVVAACLCSRASLSCAADHRNGQDSTLLRAETVAITLAHLHYLDRRLVGLVIGEGAPGRAIEIVILTTVQRPQKAEQANEAQCKSEWNQIEQDLHQIASLLRARSALSMTSTDEPDIAAAAISGVTRPAIATGTARTL